MAVILTACIVAHQVLKLRSFFVKASSIIYHIVRTAERFGLRINEGKTKVSSTDRSPAVAHFNGIQLEKVQGKKVASAAEVISRIDQHSLICYFRCSGFRSTGCRGKGYILRGQGIESFVLLSEHSHPPNFLMEKRSEIAKTLKEFAATIPGKPIDVYNSVVSIYPEIEQLWPFSRAVRTINRIRQKTGFMRTTP
ncbi:uncharacterized protein LOC143192008 [Rhynchophorus ferrugineus]|uniref:uncharacterized protein LOC143192008 n=1 Tax=Rhynchophorus ferrugineus TaxID=354439 RepID=UPI003FCD93AA